MGALVLTSERLHGGEWTPEVIHFIFARLSLLFVIVPSPVVKIKSGCFDYSLDVVL
jgi:hypothetical protein